MSRNSVAWAFGRSTQKAAISSLMRLTQRLEWWSALGLFSSSCCLLQLFINHLSVGCAGFNLLLGPFRPQLMAIALTLQAAMWHSCASNRCALKIQWALCSSLLTSTLMFFPEMLHMWVHRRRASPPCKRSSEEFIVSVSGMGCTACSAKVKATVEALSDVALCEECFLIATLNFVWPYIVL